VNASNHNARGGQGGAGGMAAGAGLYVSSGSVQISGATIEGNQALAGKGNVGGSGGNVETSGPAATGASGDGGAGEGGGIFVNAGSVQILTSTLQNNVATGGSNLMSNAGVHMGGNGIGGGLFLQSGSIVVGSSTLVGNATNGGGGTNSPGNAFGGAAVIGSGDALFYNDTIALNSSTPGGSNNGPGASFGGAFAVLAGDLKLLNDTIANNTAYPGVAPNGNPGTNAYAGALYNANGSVEMANTILAFNNATNALGISAEFFGVINSSSHDLIDNTSNPFGVYTPGPGDLTGVDPSLQPLGNYGGPTQTMPLLPGSLGIDAGDSTATGQMTLPGLVDLWKGEGNAKDSIGTQNGTVQGTVTYATGEVGKAFSFGGAGSVQFGPHAVGTSDFSVAFWIQTTNAGPQAVLGDRTTFGHGNFYGVRMNNGHVIVELDQDGLGTNYVGIVSNRTINDGLFHQVSIVRSGTTVSLYIDGILDSQGQSAGVTNLNSTNPLIIAAESGNNFPDFSGKLDEIAFYNQALSGQQVLSGYAGTITRGTDQRGGARVVGTAVDIGATEYQYNLGITGTAPATATPGSTITYNLTVTNTGLDPVTNVTFSDTLPSGVTFLALSTPFGWAIGVPMGQTVSALSGAGLAPGASATFTVTATVNSNTRVGTVLTNRVSISPTSNDSNPGNNTSSQRTTVVAPPATNVIILTPADHAVSILTEQVPGEVGIDGKKANALSFLVTGLKQGDDLPDSTKSLLGI
jgi:uncharacterized repeat protein (TIGR01451 family)